MLVRTLCSGVLLACAVTTAHAQQKPPDYPKKPIRILAPIAAGGGLDTITRVGAQILSEQWGQSAVVDNRPGGGTVIAMDLAAQALPDGYTLLSGTDSMMLVGAMKRVAYDIRKAFEPIVLMTSQWYVMIVNPSLPVKSVKDLIAYSKSKPNALNFASPGIGTNGHIGMEIFKSMTGASMTHVPYKGASPAMIDIIAGQVQLMFTSTVSAAAHMKSGKLRAIAITSPSRSRALPDLPTVAESGVGGFKMSNNYSLYAPGGTPRPIILAINKVISDGIRAPEMIKRLAGEGTEPADYLTPDAFKAMIAREYVQLEAQVKKLNLKEF
jgi:tripartite-type tricarboxylate transporter receptor subunit TctC